jgi:hypothetical protein
MDSQTVDAILGVTAMIYNFGLICLATYLVVKYDWSLWTYLGFAFFCVSVRHS